MTVSNRLQITELGSSQVERSATVNEAIAKLEAGACLFGAVSVLDNAPPGSPAEGDIHVVGTAGTGAFSGHNEAIAIYHNAAWLFLPPLAGMQAYAADEDAFYYYDVGGSWVLVSSSGGLGDVVGPASATDGAIVLFDTTTGKLIKDSGVAISTDGTFGANSDAKLATEKATKTYVDGLATNLGKRARVRVATTASVTISTALNNGDSLDGVTLATGDLVLVKNQSAQEQNGVYVVGVSPARSSEFDTYDEHPGTLIAVEEGTAAADTLWLCTSNAGGTLNTTAIVFTQFVVTTVSFTSTTEVLTGTDTSKAVTADALAALWEKGADVASASTVSLGEGGYFHITGTTTITDIDWATAKDGRVAIVVFDGILTLNHNATTLKLPSGANITTAAGDRAIFVQDAGDNVVCVGYWRADGTPLALSTNSRYRTVTFIIDGGGSAIATGVKGDIQVPFDCTILEATLLADQAGSIVVDIWKDTYANFPPTVADTIAAAAKPTLSAAQKSTDATLTGWTTSILAGDTLRYNVDSATTVTRVSVCLKVRTP